MDTHLSFTLVLVLIVPSSAQLSQFPPGQHDKLPELSCKQKTRLMTCTEPCSCYWLVEVNDEGSLAHYCDHLGSGDQAMARIRPHLEAKRAWGASHPMPPPWAFPVPLYAFFDSLGFYRAQDCRWGRPWSQNRAWDRKSLGDGLDLPALESEGELTIELTHEAGCGTCAEVWKGDGDSETSSGATVIGAWAEPCMTVSGNTSTEALLGFGRASYVGESHVRQRFENLSGANNRLDIWEENRADSNGTWEATAGSQPGVTVSNPSHGRPTDIPPNRWRWSSGRSEEIGFHTSETATFSGRVQVQLSASWHGVAGGARSFFEVVDSRHGAGLIFWCNCAGQHEPLPVGIMAGDDPSRFAVGSEPGGVIGTDTFHPAPENLNRD